MYVFEILPLIITQLLMHDKVLSIGRISELTKCKEPVIIIALGILLQDDQIRLFEQDKDLYVELK